MMRIFRRVWVAFLFCIVLIPACVKNPSLKLDYDAFDQQIGRGWGQLAQTGRVLDAAKLIDKYLKKHKDIHDMQRANLSFHAGQMYAFAGDYKTAIARFDKATYAQEPPELPIRWNTYVQATIAFLKKDLKRLKQCRKEIEEGPVFQGQKANLDVVDRLIAHFDEPYSKAYMAR